MSVFWTADGWCGNGTPPWTADGWPSKTTPWTADGYVDDRPLAGAAIAAAVAVGAPTFKKPIAGAATAAAVAHGALTAKTRFKGAPHAASVATGDLRARKRFKGEHISQSRAHGALTTAEGPPPTPPVPAEDVDLDAIFQETVRRICNLAGDLVRPRWQPIVPKQPEAGADWAAIGVTNITADASAAIIHDHFGQGTDRYYRHEDIDVLVSFYGPHSQRNATFFRDGIAVPQNTEALGAIDIRWIECGSIRQTPDLVNTKWIRRQDMTLRFRRKVTRVYGIESLLIADVHVFDDTNVDFTVVVPPHSNLEP